MNRKQLLLTLQVSILIFFGIVTSSYSQDTTAIYSSLDIPVKGYGISLGNSRAFTGLRINFQDNGVQRVTGINITIWDPYDNPDAVINGAAIGLFWPQAKRITGISAGFIGIGTNDLRGISATLGLIGGNCTGIQAAGVGIYGQDIRGITGTILGILCRQKLQGIQAAGFGIAGNDIRGIQAAPIVVGRKSLRGITASGLLTSPDIKGIQGSLLFLGSKTIAGVSMSGVIYSKNLSGIQIAGFGILSETIQGFSAAGFTVGGSKNQRCQTIRGFQIAGFSIGASDRVEGVSIAGFGVFGAQKLKGLILSGVAAGSNQNISGFTVAPGWVAVGTKTTEGILNGVSISAINFINGKQNGITIGLFNKAYSVHGVQVGLVNYISSKSGLTKVLPLINTQFR